MDDSLRSRIQHAIREFLKETACELETGDEFEVHQMIDCGKYQASVPPPPKPKLKKIA